MIYKANITKGHLRVRESRIVAEILCQEPGPSEWRDRIKHENALQFSNPTTALQIGNLIRDRLQPFGREFWEMVAEGSSELATQAVLAGAINHSRLLADFMDISLRHHWQTFAEHLEANSWVEYLEGCRGRDPDLAEWTEGTVAKLRSIVISILTEAGYLQEKTLRLQRVFLVNELVQLLERQNRLYILRCLQITT